MRLLPAIVLAAATVAVGACGTNEPTQPNSGLAPCPAGSSPITVSLPVGGVRVIGTPASLDCVELTASDAGPDSFLVVAANANPASDSLAQYAVTAGALVPAAERVAADRIASSLELRTNAVAEGRFRAMERRVLQLDRATGLRPASSLLSASRVRTQVSAAVLPNVGDTLSFNVPDANATNACLTYTAVKAVVKAVGTHGIIVQDTAAPAEFTATDFTSIRDEFDQIIYPTDTLHFGSPSDIDNNGHVFLLITPQVNLATKKGSNSVLDGFFFGGDLFPAGTAPGQCKESNETEIFYLLAPDPNAKFGDARTTSTVRQSVRGTIAHEFQHMINLGVRIRDNAPDEDTWLNEALSHFAEEIVGRAEDGFTDTQELTISDIADFSDSLKNFNAFFGQNLARHREWLINPGKLGAISSHADTSLAVRGAAWALVRWSADHYANGNVAAFTRALVAGPQFGVDNLVARSGVPFDSLMAGWLVANWSDNDNITGLDARYTYPSWNMRNVQLALKVNNNTYPLVPAPLDSGLALDRTTDSGTGDFFLAAVTPARSVKIGELKTSGGAVAYSGARLYILRVH